MNNNTFCTAARATSLGGRGSQAGASREAAQPLVSGPVGHLSPAAGSFRGHVGPRALGSGLLHEWVVWQNPKPVAMYLSYSPI